MPRDLAFHPASQCCRNVHIHFIYTYPGRGTNLLETRDSIIDLKNRRSVPENETRHTGHYKNSKLPPTASEIGRSEDVRRGVVNCRLSVFFFVEDDELSRVKTIYNTTH